MTFLTFISSYLNIYYYLTKYTSNSLLHRAHYSKEKWGMSESEFRFMYAYIIFIILCIMY